MTGPNGSQPHGNLLQASNGKLYGMTQLGGIGVLGVDFSFDPSSTAYTKLDDFDSPNGANPTGSLIQASDGKLYGLTSTGEHPLMIAGLWPLWRRRSYFFHMISLQTLSQTLMDLTLNQGEYPPLVALYRQRMESCMV